MPKLAEVLTELFNFLQNLLSNFWMHCACVEDAMCSWKVSACVEKTCNKRTHFIQTFSKERILHL